MAVHGKRAKIWANGYDLTSFLRKAATPGECEVADASTFGMDSRAKVAGQKSGKITAEGLFASALVAPLDKIDDVLQNALGVEHVVWLYAPDSDAAGARCVGLQAITNTYEIDGEVADVVSVKVEAESSRGQACEGGVILASGTDTGTGNGSDVDNGAQTLNGAACFLQVTDVAGASPSVTYKVQHSADGSAWVDLATFTAVTADHDSQVVEVTGTVERHVRATRTFGGTTTGATAAVAIARR